MLGRQNAGREHLGKKLLRGWLGSYTKWVSLEIRAPGERTSPQNAERESSQGEGFSGELVRGLTRTGKQGRALLGGGGSAREELQWKDLSRWVQEPPVKDIICCPEEGVS